MITGEVLRRRWPWLLLPAILVVAYLAERGDDRQFRPWTFLLLDAAVGITLVAGALFVWYRRPGNRSWWLLAAAGFTWFIGSFAGAWNPDVAFYALAFSGWQDFFLVWFLLAYPTGRLQARRDTAILGTFLGLCVLRTLSRLFLFVPVDISGCRCVENRFLPVTDRDWYDLADSLFRWGRTAVMVAVLASIAQRWMKASRPSRRMTTPALVAAAVLTAGLTYDTIVRPRVAAGTIDELAVLNLLATARLAVGLALVVGLVRLRSTRTRVVDLVADLGAGPPPARLGDAVGRALGDATVALHPWSSEVAAYVDDDGRPVAVDANDKRRAITYVDQRGEPVAMLVHDAVLLEDPGLVEAVTAALRLAIDNEQLTAELQTRLAEVEASRARIVEAGDDVRRRIERDLHDGAQQRLVTIALGLRLAADRPGTADDPDVRETLLQAVKELGEAVEELRDLARGIHPAILSDAGLNDALESLADRSTVTVRVECALDTEPPAPIAATIYFLVAEALTNVVKHAAASSATVTVRQDGDVLLLDIWDDGVGGADATNGSGLRGLADRLAVHGGTMQLTSPPGGGTHLRARLSCASS